MQLSHLYFYTCLQGLIHISELSWNRVFTPEAVVKIGDFVRCKVLSVNKDKGHINLSLKVKLLFKIFEGF